MSARHRTFHTTGKFLFVLFLLLSSFTKGFSQKKQLSRILFVFDDSFSMFDTWQTGQKIDVAKRLLCEFLDSLKGTDDLQVALRCFGHQFSLRPTRNCEDTKLEVPFGNVNENIEKMKTVLKRLEPMGTTPIAHTLGKCADDFPNTPGRNIIILITDGIEECGGDPCAVSYQLQQKGVILKPFIIGIGLNKIFADQMGCIGKFFDASSEEGFKKTLDIVISQALNNTTVQVNLLDQGGRPSETDVDMTFYDQYTGAIKYNYVHTINYHGNPDTIQLDPIGTYRLVVHTIPEVEKQNITLIPGKHNIIALDAPQGFLQLKVSANNYRVLPCIVRKKNDTKTLNVQCFSEKEKYIIGDYDLEILTLPRIYLKSVNISQSSTTTIEIPQAGTLYLTKPTPGPGSIYLEDGGKLVWVCNLHDDQTQENIVLQPGKYRVEYRQQNLKEAIYTVEKSFKIDSGQSTQVKLY
ncbi:MAG TPA: VWA domain-containing protein [Bacteroidia bacterium]|jgi:Ca-activated chloride channel family protein